MVRIELFTYNDANNRNRFIIQIILDKANTHLALWS